MKLVRFKVPREEKDLRKRARSGSESACSAIVKCETTLATLILLFCWLVWVNMAKAARTLDASKPKRLGDNSRDVVLDVSVGCCSKQDSRPRRLGSLSSAAMDLSQVIMTDLDGLRSTLRCRRSLRPFVVCEMWSQGTNFVLCWVNGTFHLAPRSRCLAYK